jgi:hypothetical protein
MCLIAGRATPRQQNNTRQRSLREKKEAQQQKAVIMAL